MSSNHFTQKLELISFCPNFLFKYMSLSIPFQCGVIFAHEYPNILLLHVWIYPIIQGNTRLLTIHESQFSMRISSGGKPTLVSTRVIIIKPPLFVGKSSTDLHHLWELELDHPYTHRPSHWSPLSPLNHNLDIDTILKSSLKLRIILRIEGNTSII